MLCVVIFLPLANSRRTSILAVDQKPDDFKITGHVGAGKPLYNGAEYGGETKQSVSPSIFERNPLLNKAQFFSKRMLDAEEVTGKVGQENDEADRRVSLERHPDGMVSFGKVAQDSLVSRKSATSKRQTRVAPKTLRNKADHGGEASRRVSPKIAQRDPTFWAEVTANLALKKQATGKVGAEGFSPDDYKGKSAYGRKSFFQPTLKKTLKKAYLSFCWRKNYGPPKSACVKSLAKRRPDLEDCEYASEFCTAFPAYCQ
jgi:hypothetical protein